MKTIIHATDFSENAIAALKYAYELRLKLKANLWVIHICNFSTLSSDLREPFLLSIKESFKQKNLKLKEFCTTHLGAEINCDNVKIEVIENTSVVAGIISKANELEASLIITGMKGKGAVAAFFMGSTTKQLIKKSPCPVLAIPENATTEKLKSIIYASDFEKEDISAISKLSKMAEVFDAKILIVHISTEKEYKVEEKMEWFKELLNEKVGYDTIEYYLFYSHDIYTILNLFISEVEADMVAMLEREKKGFLKKIFHTDLVKKMETYGQVPLLSFNEKNY